MTNSALNRALMAGVIAGMGVGCAGHEVTTDEDPTVGNERLGIVQFDTTETATDLAIVGINDRGETVAEFSVHAGIGA